MGNSRTRYGTTIVDRKGRPLGVQVESRPFIGGDNHSCHFRQGDVRRALMRNFDPKADYCLTHTLAHPDAVDELAKKEHRMPYAKARGIDHDDFDLAFGNDLMETYLRSIANIMSLNKRRWYASWPLVETHNVHTMDLPTGSSLWPVVHAAKGVKAGKFFLSLAQDMHCNRMYEAIRKYEHPQNYRMFPVNLLKGKNIPPLQIGRSWCAKGADFVKALDFFVQFEYEEEDHSSHPHPFGDG